MLLFFFLEIDEYWPLCQFSFLIIPEIQQMQGSLKCQLNLKSYYVDLLINASTTLIMASFTTWIDEMYLFPTENKLHFPKCHTYLSKSITLILKLSNKHIQNVCLLCLKTSIYIRNGKWFKNENILCHLVIIFVFIFVTGLC